MKFNFKKIVSVFTSTVMLTSTLALAAAANAPAPFVNGGVANAAVVVGSSASADDMGAATVVKAYLDSKVTSTGSSTISGEHLSLDRDSSRQHLGAGTSDTFGRAITASDLPTLLADGVFTSNGDNKDHDYTQKINVANLTFAQFDDNSYNNGDPALGVQLNSGANILNYTLLFSDKPGYNSDVKGSDISIMGKTYTIVGLDNSSHSIILLDSAQTQIINEGDTKSVTIGGTAYDVTVTSVSSADSPKVKVTVNGKTSSSLAIGSTYKITDGAYIGVKDATYKNANYAGAATSNAELTFGSGKLELDDGSDIKLNDNSINNLVGYIGNSSNTIANLSIVWNADGRQFVTENSSLTMPGFNNIKVSSTGFTFPSSEETMVQNDGKYTISLQTTIKDGDITIPILSNNGTAGNTSQYFVVGQDATTQLRTSNTGVITFDSDTDEQFVTSWNSGRDAESYLLYADSFVTDNGVNKTTIKGRVGSFEQKVQNGDVVTIGNAQFTVNAVNVTNRNVVLTAGSNTNFNTLYTKSGMKVILPSSDLINFTTGNTSSYNLIFSEADKDGNLAKKNFTIPLGLTSKNYVTVGSITGLGGDGLKEIGSTGNYVGYLNSDLATKISNDQSPDQETATISYHGGESYGNVIVSDVSAIVNGGSSGVLIVKDNEASAMTGKNLVVVGGSCINTVAATLLGSSTPLCGTAWEAATNAGAGSFVINSYAYGSNVATLVAGYNQADTTNAAQYLKTHTNVDTTAGKKYTGTTATADALVVA
jgi:hypothetical protein